MNIEAVSVSLAAPENSLSQNVTDTKTTLSSGLSFAEKLGYAKANSSKDKSAIVNKNSEQDNTQVIDQTDQIDDDSLAEVKSTLSQKGFTQNEIDSVKNLKDLKKLLKSKVEDGTLKTGEDLTNLLGMLGGILGGKAQESLADVSNILDSVTPDIKTAVTNFLSSSPAADALKTFQDETDKILSSEKQEIESLKPEDLKLVKAALANDVKNVVNNPTSELTAKIQKEITSILDKYKSDNSIIKLNQVKPDLKLNIIANSQDLKGENLADKSSSDDNILTKLVEPDTDTSKIDKATNFMTQFANTTTPVKTVLPETPIIDIKNVNADIVNSLNYMQQGDIKNLTVTITPKELGTVIINLIMQNGTMVASITAANKEAYNLINANLPDISTKLQHLNMTVQDVSLSVYNQDTTFFKDGSRWQEQQQNNQSRNKNQSKQTVGILDEPAKISDPSILNSNVNILA